MSKKLTKKEVYDYAFKAVLNKQKWTKEVKLNMIKKFGEKHGVKINMNDIVDYMKAVQEDKQEKIYSERFNRKFVFNYLGAWFFDIGFNHKDLKGNDTPEGLGKWGVIMHGNSGWVKLYELESKQGVHLKAMLDDFMKECQEGLNVRISNEEEKTVQYPVKKIVSDGEPGVPAGEYKGVKIEKHATTTTGHRFMGRIDSFMSHLREYAFKVMNEDTTWIPYEIVADFVDLWNLKPIPGLSCTRAEMMTDIKLEEAYICAALYGNQNVQEGFEQFVGKNNKVKLYNLNRQKPFGNRQAKAANEEPGTYLLSFEDGQTIATDVNDPKIKKRISPNDVKATIYTNKFFNKELKRLANVDDTINIKMISQQSNISKVPKKKPAEPTVAEQLADPKVLEAVSKQRVMEARNREFDRTLPTKFVNDGDFNKDVEKEKERLQQAVRKADIPAVQASGRKHPMITRSMDNPENILQDTMQAGEAPRGDIKEVVNPNAPKTPKMNKLTEKEKATQDELIRLHKQAIQSEKHIKKGAQEHIVNILIEQAKDSPVNRHKSQVPQERLTSKRGFNKPSQYVANADTRTIFSRREHTKLNKRR